MIQVLPKPDGGTDTPAVAKDWFKGRGARSAVRSLEQGAHFYQLDESVRVAVNTALALGEPLLVTGEPGTGKTQLAYYLAQRLDCGPVLRFQVKSTSQASDVLYQFDAVRYFHAGRAGEAGQKIEPTAFREKGVLWQAIESERPRVVLIDEIDKAPRDFPNDLLQALDEYQWSVLETGEHQRLPPEEWDRRPVVIITSNDEHKLPAAFLRRCLHCHIPFSRELLQRAVEARAEELNRPDPAFIQLALDRFEKVRELAARKRPSTAEALVWLRALRGFGVKMKELESSLAELPHLEALLKDEEDREALKRRG